MRDYFDRFSCKVARCLVPNRDEGYAALYILTVLPILLLLMGTALDVAGWQALREDVQRSADIGALRAARALPDRNQAIAIAESTINSLVPKTYKKGISILEEGAVGISVKLSAQYSSIIESIFPFFASLADSKAFFVEREAVAETLPFDYILAFPDGATLRPRLTPTILDSTVFQIADPWGNQTEWPAASILQCSAVPHIPIPDWSASQSFNFKSPVLQRWITQGCFNPIYSTMKGAIMDSVKAIARSSVDRLAVFTTPGISNPSSPESAYSALRHLSSESDDPELFKQQAGGFFHDGDARKEAHWLGYLSSDLLVSDELCYLISRSTETIEPRYHSSNIDPRRLDRLCQPGSNPIACNVSLPSIGSLSSCHEANISLLESVYWHAIRFEGGSTQALPSLLAVVNGAIRELSIRSQKTEATARRRNLAPYSKGVVIVIIDHLPTGPLLESTIKSLQILTSLDADVYLISFHHYGLTPAEDSDLNQAETDLYELLKPLTEYSELVANSRTSSGHISLTIASNQEELANSILPSIINQERRYVLRR